MSGIDMKKSIASNYEAGRKQGALEELEKVKVMFNRLTIGKFLDWLYEEKKEPEKKVE